MTLSPEPLRLRLAQEAWQSALGQLQMEMPKASFDTWVRDTRLVDYEDGHFSIGVCNTYAREWLESRLTSTITRLLMGIMNREVSVRFVVDMPVVEEDADGKDEPEMAEVEVVHKLRYDEVVLPERVVALPGYFSRLIPEIGARNAWLYVGWRQAVWDGQRQDSGFKTRRVPVREIIRFSGLSRRTFFRAVHEPSTWEGLSGLVERCDEEPRWARGKDRRAHRLPNHYTVLMTLPLSLADAASVQKWLETRMREGTSLLDALRRANEIQDLVGELLPPLEAQLQKALQHIPKTVMEIAGQLAGGEVTLPPDLQGAAEKLHQKIVMSFGIIIITHYFLGTVIPTTRLTPSQAWLVTLLRDRCFLNRDTGEVRDEMLVRGEYAELASWLGLTRSKTVWEWIRDEQGPISAFLAVLPGQDRDDANSLRLQVRLEEPIFDGMCDTISMAHVAPTDGADDTIKLGAIGTHRVAEMAPLSGAAGTLGWREWHGLKHLNTSQNTPERITSTTQGGPAAAPVSCPAGVMPAGWRTGGTTPPDWNLRKILVQSHVHPKVMKDLLAKNASVQAFVSWLLYACSRAGEGIQNPLAYTLASLREDPVRGPGGAYDQLAGLPPAELIRLARWAIRRSSQKYCLTAEASGNELWDRTMGASERHGILPAILLGEEDTTTIWNRKVTQVVVDGEEIQHETEITRTYPS